MRRSIYGLLLLLFLLAGLWHFAGNSREQPRYRELYLQACKIFDSRETDEAGDSTAIALFNRVIMLLNGPERNDSLLFECYNKAGILSIGLDRPQEAISYFNQAIAWGARLKKPRIDLFDAWLYNGRSWYDLGNYDSSLYCCRTAEQIADSAIIMQPMVKNLPNSQRLYNMLGVLYYDLGNYMLAKKYFEKSLTILQTAAPDNRDFDDLYFRYQNNIAACLLKLDDYDQANNIYDDLLQRPGSSNIRNILLHRKADINLLLGAAEKALNYLKQVKYNDRNRLKLLNDYGRIYFNLGDYKKAELYLDSSLQLNISWFPSGKNSDLANTRKVKGDILEAQGRYSEALGQYQLSLTALVNGYDDTAVTSNPGQFKGLFAANTLFENLSAKAATLEKQYRAGKQQAALEAALAAYRSAFELAEYMERMYDSEASRLLLNRKKYAIHDKPIQLSLHLYELTKDKKYLEDAFYFDQQNKGSALKVNLNEQHIKKQAGIPDSLLARERELQLRLTAFSLKAGQQMSDSVRQQQDNEMRDLEIDLNKIREKMRTYSRYSGYEQQLKHQPASMLIKKIPHNTCVLSWHLGDSSLVCFWLRHNDWNYVSIPVNDSFFTVLESLVQHYYSSATGSAYTAGSQGMYSTLLAELEPHFNGVNTLLIVPDDELHALPFETLINSNGQYLAQRYATGYNFSCNLFFGQGTGAGAKQGLLAMAPFAGGGRGGFSQLRSSAGELQCLDGKKLYDHEATLENFKQLAPHYSILHLATHANAGNTGERGPYIVFAPGGDSASQYLYSREIYDLQLDSTRLVYLSACETGQGKLVRGEGMLSLSRAFAYAGCPNIITSLWQADDASTALITNSFYSYFNAGVPGQEALQRARNDYLNNPQVDRRKKTPFYWAHLVFVGQTGQYRKPFNSWLIIGPAVTALLAVAFVMRRKLKRQV